MPATEKLELIYEATATAEIDLWWPESPTDEQISIRRFTRPMGSPLAFNQLRYIPNDGFQDHEYRRVHDIDSWARSTLAEEATERSKKAWADLHRRMRESVERLSVGGKHGALEMILGRGMQIGGHKHDWHRQLSLLEAAEIYW